MPTPTSILDNLALVARAEWPYAIVWHLVLVVALVTLAFGWRPLNRTATAALALPLASVSAFAWVYGNGFNGLLLGAGALALLIQGQRLPQGPVRRAAPLPAAMGASLIVFGSVYPHFLEGASLFVYAYAAPLGLLPCPTLSVVIGLTLLAGGFGSRAWSVILALLGLFYGLFGALHLGVWMDFVLASGAMALLGTALAPRLAPLSQRHIPLSR